MIGLLTAIVVALVTMCLLLIPPIVMNDMINRHVHFSKVYTAEEFGLSSQQIMLKTSDGLELAAYEVTVPNPKATIIFLSGIHNPSVTAFYGHAKWLLENGYNSILVEMRAHGPSEGSVICLGYKEHLDVRAAVEYLTSKYSDVPIVVFGLSMGGATAINSIGEIDEIDAVISMSAYSAWEDAFADNMVGAGVPRFIAAMQKPFVKLFTTIKYGLSSFSISPKQAISKIGNRPALIIHSRNDSQIPFASFIRIMKNAPEHVESWVKEGDHHFILESDDLFLYPEKNREYSQRVLDFLDRHFAGTVTQAAGPVSLDP